MWANNEVGTVQPVAELAAVAAEHGVPFHTDAVQAVGQLPVDFAAAGVDALTLTGHKLGGPVGVGALLLGRDVDCAPLLHGGGQERDVRSGTLDTAGIVGARGRRPRPRSRPGRSRGPGGGAARRAGRRRPGRGARRGASTATRLDRLPGNAHFSFPGCEGDSLLLLLDARGIECSTGSACSAGVAQPSHVLLAMGADEDRARGSLRFTLGHTSTGADVDALLAALARRGRAGPAGRAARAGTVEGAGGR